MNIDFNKENDTLIVRIQGRLDTLTAPQLEEFLNQNVDGIKHLIFDLKEMPYTSSQGLRLFLKSQKRMNACGGDMVIENVCSDVFDVFEATGFTSFLTIR